MAHPALHSLVTDFERRFGHVPQVFRAPGRVNLIGEHTDYNDGFVMPAAIDFSTWVAAGPRNDDHFVVASREFPDQFEFSLAEPSSRQGRWTA